MTLRRNWHWLAVGAALAGAVALHAREAAAADKRIQVWAVNDNVNCKFDAQMNAYMGEELGRDALGRTVCEAFTTGGTAMSLCEAGVTQHMARITKRANGTRALIGSPLASVPWQAWNTGTGSISAVLPAVPGNNCPGSTLRVVGYGRDVP